MALIFCEAEGLLSKDEELRADNGAAKLFQRCSCKSLSNNNNKNNVLTLATWCDMDWTEKQNIRLWPRLRYKLAV